LSKEAPKNGEEGYIGVCQGENAEKKGFKFQREKTSSWWKQSGVNCEENKKRKGEGRLSQKIGG